MANGFQMGGAAKAFPAVSSVFQNQQQLKLQEQQLQQKQAADLLAKGQKLVDDAVKQATDAMTIAQQKAATAETPEMAAEILDNAKKGIDLLEQSVTPIGVKIQIDPATLKQRFTNIREMPTIAQQQKLKAQETTATETAKAEVKQQFEEGKPFTATLIEDPNKQIPVILKNGQYIDTRNNAPIDVNKYKITRVPGIEAATLEGATGLTKKEREKSRAGLSEAQVAIDSMAKALVDVRKTPGATGVRGLLADKVGGILGQLPGVGGTLEQAFTKVIANASPEEVSKVRTQSRLLVAQNLSAITGEESGRFTESERGIAEQVLKGLPADASIAQIVTAMKTVMELSIDSELRESERLGKPIFNLDSNEGINKFGNYLIDLGFSEDEALDIVKERVKRRGRRQ